MAIPDDRREAFLALDTSSPLVSVALAQGGSVICQRVTEIRRSSERLIEMIDSVLGEADLRLAELAGVVALRGPGSFTGLRIGMSTALGFHQALGLPVAAVPTLVVLSYSVAAEPGPVLAVVDALRGEWFTQRFELAGSDRDAGKVHRCTTEELPRLGPATVVGFGVERLAATLQSPEFTLFEAGPLAGHAALLAPRWSRWEASELLQPMYLREPAATPSSLDRSTPGC